MISVRIRLNDHSSPSSPLCILGLMPNSVLCYTGNLRAPRTYLSLLSRQPLPLGMRALDKGRNAPMRPGPEMSQCLKSLHTGDVQEPAGCPWLGYVVLAMNPGCCVGDNDLTPSYSIICLLVQPSLGVLGLQAAVGVGWHGNMPSASLYTAVLFIPNLDPFQSPIQVPWVWLIPWDLSLCIRPEIEHLRLFNVVQSPWQWRNTLLMPVQNGTRSADWRICQLGQDEDG